MNLVSTLLGTTDGAAMLAPGQALGEREYVPMSWGAGGERDEALPDYLAMDQVTHLLGFNESDNCNDQSGQYGNPKLCNVHHRRRPLQEPAESRATPRIPGNARGGAQNKNGWLNQFITQCEDADIRIDFIALHWYDWESSPKTTPWFPPAKSSDALDAI